MLKKILSWFTGSAPSDNATVPEAPYKLEPPAQEEGAWPFPTERADDGGASVEQSVTAETDSKPKKKSQAKKSKTEEVWPFPGIDPSNAATTAPVEVKAKFKRADLAKMTKAELLDIIKDKGLEVKARAAKDELIKVILKG